MRNAAICVAFISLLFTSCATTKSVAKTGVTDLINCESPQIRNVIPDLLPQVQEILRDGSPNYQQMLDDLIGSQEAALACAVYEAWHTFRGHASMAATDGHAVDIAARADAYLKVKSYSFQQN